MNYRNVLGLVVISAFAAKGLFQLHQYYNYRSSYNQSLANVAKDGINSINDLTKIYSNNKREVELCDDIAQMGKGVIDITTEVEYRRRRQWDLQ